MLTVDSTVVVVVDVQVKLAHVMPDRDAVIDGVSRLVRGSAALNVPVVWTEQYPDGLGPTVPELAGLIAGEPVVKRSFSCCGEPSFTEAMDRVGRRQVLLAGMETHVCVYQTAVDLLAGGCEVQVVSDAVCSRTAENRGVGLARMVAAGASITSVETALFELLKVAEGPAFKAILQIVK